MSRVQAGGGARTTVIALCLGHTDVRYRRTYLKADRTIRQKVFELVIRASVRPGRDKATDRVLLSLGPVTMPTRVLARAASEPRRSRASVADAGCRIGHRCDLVTGQFVSPKARGPTELSRLNPGPTSID